MENKEFVKKYYLKLSDLAHRGDVDVISQKIAFYVKDRVLYVEDGLKYEVYDMSMRKFYSGCDKSIHLPCGIYLIKINCNINKVIIK